MNEHDNHFDNIFAGERGGIATEQPHAMGNDEYETRARAREERRRKMKQRRRAMMAVIVIAVVLGVGGFFASSFAGSLWDRVTGGSEKGPDGIADYPGPGTGTVEVSVNQGDTGEDIATTLKQADVIATRKAYLDVASNNPDALSIQPGTYELKQQMSAGQALAVLVNPENRVDFIITIPEGWTFNSVNAKVQSVLGVSAEEVEASLEDTDATGLPKVAGGNYEGWLAPGQYVYPRDVEISQVFAQMIDRRKSELSKMGIEGPDRQEVLIKASILQKEVNPDNYTKVARVIDNRLAAGRALEMDSTVGYGAGKEVMTLTRPEFRDSSNLYNTYEHVGLPPGPIANPSNEAIKGVLNPEEGDWMYFVTVNLDTGETKFAVTWDEFSTYLAEYREWKDKNYEQPEVTP